VNNYDHEWIGIADELGRICQVCGLHNNGPRQMPSILAGSWNQPIMQEDAGMCPAKLARAGLIFAGPLTGIRLRRMSWWERARHAIRGFLDSLG
jgi:hypothetical protein